MSEKWNVLLPGQMDDIGPNELTDIAEMTWLHEYRDQSQIVEDIHTYDAILARGSFDVTGDLVRAADNLKVISKHGVGVDNIAVDAASKRGIVVCNTPGANAQAVAEHAIGLILSVRKQLPKANEDMQDGVWDREKYCSPELRGATLGIFGCGNIGGRVASFANAIGMRCIVYDPYPTDNQIPPYADRANTKGDLFEAADVVTVHSPLTSETCGAITASELSKLPTSGIVVNTARGGIIDEDDLIDALLSGELAGAGIDVFATEPVSRNHNLFELENVVTTPHIAGTSDGALREKSRRATRNIRCVYDGKVPKSTVNVTSLCGELRFS